MQAELVQVLMSTPGHRTSGKYDYRHIADIAENLGWGEAGGTWVIRV